MRKNPSTRWFFNDWEEDEGLQACSFAAQGFWMRMLCVCARNDGYFLLNGKVPSIRALAVRIGCPESCARKWLKECADNGVFSYAESGAIFNRRMARNMDEASRAPNARVRSPHITPNPTSSRLHDSYESLDTSVCVAEERAQARTHTNTPLDLWSPEEQHFDKADELGRTPSWVDQQAIRYRLHQTNAKRKNSNHHAGFMLWIIDTARDERPSNRNAPMSPNGKLYAGAYDAIRQLERQRNSYQSRRLTSPLLDS